MRKSGCSHVGVWLGVVRSPDFILSEMGRCQNVSSRTVASCDLCFHSIAWPALWRRDCGDVQRRRKGGVAVALSPSRNRQAD